MSRPGLITTRRSLIRAPAGALAALGLLAGSLALAGPAAAAPRHPARAPADVRFVQFTTASNRRADSTFINNRATNGKPHALLFVTPNWNPSNTHGGIYDNRPIGVWYDAGTHRWAIFNEDRHTMALRESFNVLVVPRSSSTAFTLTASSLNIGGDSMDINKAATNHHGSAQLQVTQNWDPSGHGGTYNNDNIGVWYDGAHWLVFQQDTAAMTVGASFNVLVGTRGTGAFGTVLKARHSNISDNWVTINNRRTNNNSRAMVFATPDWNPGGVGGTYDPSPIGVWYDKSVSPKVWAVFNQNTGSSMPNHAAFNLLIYRTR